VKHEDINTFTIIKSDENYHIIIDECGEILRYRYYIVNCSEYLKKRLQVIKGTVRQIRNCDTYQELLNVLRIVIHIRNCDTNQELLNTSGTVT
jgi:hypothetical protein